MAHPVRFELPTAWFVGMNNEVRLHSPQRRLIPKSIAENIGCIT